jgi:hypothetical protein
MGIQVQRRPIDTIVNEALRSRTSLRNSGVSRQVGRI